MILFSEKRKDCEPLYHKDLQFLGKQLNDFIKTYSKLVTVEDPEVGKAINTLTDISEKLLQGRYETLIADPSIISTEDPPIDNYPYY